MPLDKHPAVIREIKRFGAFGGVGAGEYDRVFEVRDLEEYERIMKNSNVQTKYEVVDSKTPLHDWQEVVK